MAHDRSPGQSLFSQVVVGVVVSVLTAVVLKGLGLADPETRPSAAAALAASPTVRLSFASPEPEITLPPPEALLFDHRQTSSEVVRGLLPESQRLHSCRR